MQRDPEAGRPLLKEAAGRLENKVAHSAEIKPGAFLVQVKALAFGLRPDLPDAKDTKDVDTTCLGSVGLFMYGRPVLLDSAAQRKAVREAATPKPEVEPELTLAPTDPGYNDIAFPGLTDDAVPQWVRGALKRLHSDLGHPGNAA